MPRLCLNEFAKVAKEEPSKDEIVEPTMPGLCLNEFAKEPMWNREIEMVYFCAYLEARPRRPRACAYWLIGPFR